MSEGAARARDLHVLENGMDLSEKLIGSVRFADYTGHATGQHALDAALGLPQEAGAEQYHHGGIHCSQPAKCFFAVHERHGEVEQNQIESGRLFPKLCQAVEAGLSSYDFKASFGE